MLSNSENERGYERFMAYGFVSHYECEEFGQEIFECLPELKKVASAPCKANLVRQGLYRQDLYQINESVIDGEQSESDLIGFKNKGHSI